MTSPRIVFYFVIAEICTLLCHCRNLYLCIFVSCNKSAETGMLDKWIHRLLESALKDLSI